MHRNRKIKPNISDKNNNKVTMSSIKSAWILRDEEELVDHQYLSSKMRIKIQISSSYLKPILRRKLKISYQMAKVRKLSLLRNQPPAVQLLFLCQQKLGF